MKIRTNLVLSVVSVLFLPTIAAAQSSSNCAGLPDHAKLKQALTDVVRGGPKANGGMANQEWAAVVNRDGIICQVVFSGPSRSSEWPGSRLIAAEKASTANAFSTNDFALSTGNLFTPAQPGQSLYGIVAPPNPAAAYAGNPEQYGQTDDPMIGKPIGGVIVFAGGLPLYTSKGELIGGLGVSGNTSCADHVVAWKTRHALGLDAVPMGVGPEQSDNLIFDIQNGNSLSGFGYPPCKGGMPSKEIIEGLNRSFPTGPKK